MRLRQVEKAFDHPDYIFELKHDGFRAVVYLQNGECKILSRNLNDMRFASLKEALAKLPVQNAILDGEIVCLDKNGVSRFYQLLSHKGTPVYYAFDLLWLNGEDLRPPCRRPARAFTKPLKRLLTDCLQTHDKRERRRR
jgi:bifunctional non-homologous end joining protein LigD